MKLFRKIRRTLLKENRVTKYLVYAFGEIILVVIGILIAIGINNWNNDRIAQNQLKIIYKQIHTDLVKDTTQISNLLYRYKTLENGIRDILDKKIDESFYDTINEQNFRNCRLCFPLTTNYYAITPNTKGFDQLMNSGVDLAMGQDSILDKIFEFQNLLPTLQLMKDDVVVLTDQNIKTFEQYPWFVDMMDSKFNREFLVFIFESEVYRKQLALYRLYYEDNYLKYCKILKKYAKDLIQDIELRLNEG